MSKEIEVGQKLAIKNTKRNGGLNESSNAPNSN